MLGQDSKMCLCCILDYLFRVTLNSLGKRMFSHESFLAALPILPWNNYDPGSIEGRVFASMSETFPLWR